MSTPTKLPSLGRCRPGRTLSVGFKTADRPGEPHAQTHHCGSPGNTRVLNVSHEEHEDPRNQVLMHVELFMKSCHKESPFISMSSREAATVTLTRGTLKATGSRLVLLSFSARAISTLRTSHSVLGRNEKPWRRDASSRHADAPLAPTARCACRSGSSRGEGTL